MTDAPASLSPATTLTDPQPRSLRLPQLLLLYLGPGVCLTIFYLLTAPLLQAAGLPPVWGLLLGALVVIVPIEGGLLLYLRRRPSAPLLGGSPLVVPLARPVRRDIWLVPLAVLGAFLLPGIGVPLEPWLRATFFGWLPPWFSAGVSGLSSYSPSIQLATIVLWLLSVVLIGPIVEELYFRGFLLPRTANGTWLAPLLNAVLFAIYHFWQPYAVLTITLFTLPLAYIVWWRKNVVLSIIAHCLINLIAFLALLGGIVQR